MALLGSFVNFEWIVSRLFLEFICSGFTLIIIDVETKQLVENIKHECSQSNVSIFFHGIYYTKSDQLSTWTKTNFFHFGLKLNCPMEWIKCLVSVKPLQLMHPFLSSLRFTFPVKSATQNDFIKKKINKKMVLYILNCKCQLDRI